MSRPTIGTLMLAIAAVLLAIGLFVAGAMWRARVTRASMASPQLQGAVAGRGPATGPAPPSTTRTGLRERARAIPWRS